VLPQLSVLVEYLEQRRNRLALGKLAVVQNDDR
jgi:hypothetical protein